MRIGIGKTSLDLSFTFTAIITVMLILCDESVVLLCLLSSLFHEGGHLLFMCLFGDVPKKISLGAFGIRIDRGALLSYKKEAVVALGGIIFNFVLCFFAAVWYLLAGGEFPLKIITVNSFVAALNSFPAGVLDMGRALRCLLLSRFPEDRAYKIADGISLVSALLLVLGFIIYTALFGLNFSFAAVTIYLFVITIIKKWS